MIILLKMKKALLLLLLASLNICSHAQGLQLEWVNAFNNTLGLSEGHNVICDPEDNVYTLAFTSTTSGSFDADPSVGSEALIENTGTVLAKYSSAGDYLWSVYLGNAQDGSFNLYGDFTFDVFGDLVIVGSFFGDVDFDPSPNEELQSSEFGSLFIAKYSTEGDFIMVKTMPLAAQAFFALNGIDTDANGNIFIGGSIQNNGISYSIDFDPSIGEANFLNNANGASFIAKYSSTGDLQFVNTIQGGEGGGSNRLIDIKLDSEENIWITGEVTGPTDFDPSEGEFLVDEIGKVIFVAKYNAQGEFLLVKSIVGGGTKLCRGIAMDTSDNAYITGEFSGAVDFDSGIEESILVSEQGREPFLAKFSNQGDLIFAFDLDSDANISDANSPRSITTDEMGYVYITGLFQRSCDFDPSEDEFILTPQSNDEAFLAKYDEQGNFIWAFGTAGSLFTFSLDVFISSAGVATMVGLFRVAADFDPGEADTETVGISGNTMFLAKYAPCNYSSDEVSICEGEIYQASTRSLTEAGAYQVSYLSSSGCDSIVNLELTVNPLPDATINTIDNVLSSIQENASYQWINCDGNLPIEGETLQEYTALESGNYAVVVELDNCSSTSDCVNIIVQGISKIDSEWKGIFPNPSNGNFQMQLEVGEEVSIYDSAGSLIYRRIAQIAGIENFNLSQTGMFNVILRNGNSVKNQKLILLP